MECAPTCSGTRTNLYLHVHVCTSKHAPPSARVFRSERHDGDNFRVIEPFRRVHVDRSDRDDVNGDLAAAAVPWSAAATAALGQGDIFIESRSDDANAKLLTSSILSSSAAVMKVSAFVSTRGTC